MNEIKTEPNIGNRIFAGIIDYGIIYAFTFLMVFMLGEPNSEGIYELNGAPVLIPVLFWYIMTVGLEIGLGGTLGNSLVGLKAIPIDGENRKLTFIESLKRHLLDPIDMLFFGIVGIVTINKSDKHQRIGDKWADTIVVKMSDFVDLKS